MAEETIFSKIIRQEIPAPLLYQDDLVSAFRDINPQAPLHALVIPRKHIATINDLQADDAALVGKLFLAAKQVAKEAGYAEDGYRVVMNCGLDAGQTVFHIHLHILAGRALSWPPG
jgi:histidine triad (HIT) family protein